MAAYAVEALKCDASITPTLLHGVSCGGVTFCQWAPSSRVSQIKPSSVPAQIWCARAGDGAIQYTTPRRGSPVLSATVAGSRLGGTVVVFRVRSGLMIFQLLPPSGERKTT